MDRRQTGGATNVFALCELRALEWRVYRRSAPADSADAKPPPRGSKARALPEAADALAAQARKLQHEDALCALVAGADVGSGENELWVFHINSGGQDGATDIAAASNGAISVWADGVWSRDSQLPENVQQTFFVALQELATRRLVSQGEFVLEGSSFERNDAKFVYRCPSSARLDCLEVYLDEDIPVPVFQLHFRLLLPSSLLTVTVHVERKNRASSEQQGPVSKMDGVASSWERLMGLPSTSNPSMIDVWHLDDYLAPRIVAETRHRDVVARFRAVTRKSRKRGDEADAGNDQEDGGKKGDEIDEDAEEDEDDAAHDADGDTADELTRRALTGASKKKRKRSGLALLAENDDSIVPVSPDTHVNSPDASAPTVRMTFPHDVEVQLHAAPDVQLYKRKLTRTKKRTAGRSPLEITFGPLATSGHGTTNGFARISSRSAPAPFSALSGSTKLALQVTGRNVSPLATVKMETKPTLSVAVSLVESLSHNEQQEAFDARPVKTHPLLQALQDYVDNEAKIALDTEIQRQKVPKMKVIANAESFIPSVQQVCILSAVNTATTQRLQLQLLADQFKHWRSEYKNLYYPAKKNRRYQAKAHEQRLLLEFSEAKLEDWAYQQALMHSKQAEKVAQATRDREIAIGTTLAASDAMIAWRHPQFGSTTHGGHCSSLRVASTVDKKVIVAQLQPFLEELTSRLSGIPTKVKSPAPVKTEGAWLSLENYLSASVAPDPSIGKNNDATSPRTSVDSSRWLTINRPPPAMVVATADSSYQIAPASVSEYLLRGLHPMSAPKPVDYVVVCPHSPSQWLGSLSLSHITGFRSMYAQCHMGDMCPVDLTALSSNEYASVDAANATVLLDCASTTADAFANFRAAGELLRPVLSVGVKKQAFARSPVGNVVFLVAPFRRQDVKHKLWLLGAFARGLFGWESLQDATSSASQTWKDGVTIEILYLDDLFASELNPSPHTSMANCFALFDRVGEGVTLTPLSTVTNGAADPQSRSRFVCERLYQVADWRQYPLASTPRRQQQEQASDKAVTLVHGGYSISSDGNWLLFACIDAVGSVCESRAVSLVDTDLVTALGHMVSSLLSFLTLFGEQAGLVITRLSASRGDSSHKMDDMELFAWEDIRANHWGSLLPAEGGASALATRVLLTLLTTPSDRELQPLDNEETALVVSAREGILLQSLSSDGRCGAASRVSACAEMFSATCARPAGSRVLRLTVVRDLSLDTDDASAGYEIEPILRDFHALSFLTTHPVASDRQSPLPLHLAVVRAMSDELDVLKAQLATDPLVALHA